MNRVSDASREPAAAERLSGDLLLFFHWLILPLVMQEPALFGSYVLEYIALSVQLLFHVNNSCNTREEGMTQGRLWMSLKMRADSRLFLCNVIQGNSCQSLCLVYPSNITTDILCIPLFAN